MDQEKANQHISFLGRGWGFPPTFSKAAKGVTMVADEEDIRQSLHILLSTQLGERIMRPDYGCDLSKLLFEPLNTTLQTYMKDLIRTAILYHEPRVKLEHVVLETDEQLAGKININIDYMVKATNSRNNIVYPFYQQEGSDIRS